jgi:membrane peptidoglycan carboxypeptidase
LPEKTGTSRDGWFAGFTPEIVTVVYVGFDDGSDLGMKGSDSAMPIWAEFMREALNRNPEWNGDWQMPATVRQAEIDTRNGKLIRELNSEEADSIKTQQTVLKNTNANTNSNTDAETLSEIKEVYVTDVPPEFRRVEFFVSGTVPNKVLLPSEEAGFNENSEANPKTTPTPFTTWQEAQQDPGKSPSNPPGKSDSENENPERNTTVMICRLTGMRATRNCLDMQPQTFKGGKEPKSFAVFTSTHRNELQGTENLNFHSFQKSGLIPRVFFF